MDLVSICIPTYNGAEFLEFCLMSAINQTYSAIEIIVVDDCSSDSTLQIAQAFASDHPAVSIVTNKINLGLVGNWNRCIELANGTWIKFLFQDDLLHPNCVEKLVEEGQRQEKRLIGCDRDFIFDSSISEDMKSAYLNNRNVINSFLGLQRGASAAEFATKIARHISYNYFGEPTVALIRSDIFEEYGNFDLELAQICDLEFWARVGGQEGLAFVPETLATFRAHGTGTSATNRKGKSFRASGLDPLIMLTHMLNDSKFVKLRYNWKKNGILKELESQHYDRANEVREYALSHGDESCGEKNIYFEYQSILEKYPKCRIPALHHWLWLSKSIPARWKYRLGQKINPILPKNLRREKSLPF